MAFKKAKPLQAYFKASMYGPAGSGKTLTALLLAEGLAHAYERRVAFVDTERGTDFYAQEVPERSIHPKAFDFDAKYTKSITEILKEVRDLDPAVHGVVVIDSMTHVWEACKAAYQGRTNKAGQFPMWAWQKIKKPWRELMDFLINAPFHVLLLGRQGNEFSEDEETGEVKMLGYKMKAEGETAYEPHITLRMEAVKVPGKAVKGTAESVITAHVEKDRTGILHGKAIPLPNFEKVCRPILPLLGKEQAQLPSEEEAAAQDAETLAAQDRDRERDSAALRREFEAKFHVARTRDEIEAVSKSITVDVKRRMFSEHTQALRDAYLAALDRVKTSNGAAV